MSRRTTTVAFFASLGASVSASAQTPPAEAPQAPPAAPAPAPAPPAPPEGSPPPEYYIETPAQEGTGREAAPPEPPPGPPPRIQVYEPPAPVYEPPPPPVPRHVAPKTAFWLGARLGWFLPFGNVYARNVQIAPYTVYEGIPWSDFASSGPMFEVDAGMRLSRNYNLFALWERAQLGSGDADVRFSDGTSPGDQDGGDTDFYGVGLRASSDANRVGFLTELALGYRRARTHFEDGSELQFTDGILEGRLGLGADIRVSPFFSLSPMATIGVGSFGDIEFKRSNGQKFDVTGPNDQGDGHAWFTLQLGGHFDLAVSK